MINILLYISSSWFIYNLIEYSLHYISHNPKSGYIYKIHKRHHVIHYPVNNLLSKEYKTSYTYGIPDGIMAHGLPMGAIIGISYNILDYDSFLKILYFILVYASISDYLHTHIHTENTWLTNYNWFIIMRELHFNHHKKTSKNFSVLDMNIDKLLGTYKS